MTEDERPILRALALMCAQYIGHDDEVDHACMAAGEAAVAVLVQHRMLEPAARGGRWTAAGHALMR